MKTTWESRHCSRYIEEMEQKKQYKMYCKAKKEINEKPFDFKTWLQMEQDLND